MRLETQLQALAMIGTGLSVILSNERHVFSISEITSLVAAGRFRRTSNSSRSSTETEGQDSLTVID